MTAFPLVQPGEALPRNPSISAIQRVTADTFGIPVGEMVSARRSACVAQPRQVAMYLARDLTPFSLPNIGRFFGGRDHTTVIHAIKCVESRIAADDDLAGKVEAVRAELVG